MRINAIKNILFAITLMVSQSLAAQVREIWETTFTPPWKGNQSFVRGSVPEDFMLTVILSIDKTSDGVFTGEMQFTGQVRCRGIAKIETGKIEGDLISFKSEPLPVIQCPAVSFSGKVVADTWVGVLPWNGKNNEVIFKKR
jgi:hypothetical protein